MNGTKEMDEKTLRLTALMHKAIAIIQFKEEGKLFEKHPEWKMQNRALFNYIDYEKGTIRLDGKEYALHGNNFPTVDPKHPNELTPEEQDLMNRLNHSFMVSEKLHSTSSSCCSMAACMASATATCSSTHPFP